MAIPAGYFPQKFLFSGIVSYDCKLAETYNAATDALSRAFAPMEDGKATNKDAYQIPRTYRIAVGVRF